MAILKNVEIWYTKLDPKKPNTKFNKEQPTWEVQLRTRDKKQAQEWKDLNLKVNTDTDADEKVFYRVNLKKKSKKKDGTPVEPVKVVNGALDAIDPNTIGNGSIGNVRIFQYEYGEESKIASMLMAIQLTKHVVYEPKPSEDDFEMTETIVEKTADSFEDNGVEDPEF
jgi:hypothetical protein